MLRLNILISCFMFSFLIINYLVNADKNHGIALSQSDPEVKYERQSVRQIRKYKPIKGAVKKKNPKGLAKKTRPNDKLANRDEVFLDEDGVKFFPMERIFIRMVRMFGQMAQPYILMVQ